MCELSTKAAYGYTNIQLWDTELTLPSAVVKDCVGFHRQQIVITDLHL